MSVSTAVASFIVNFFLFLSLSLIFNDGDHHHHKQASKQQKSE